MCHFKAIIIFFVHEKFINELCGSIMHYIGRITNGQILLCATFLGACRQHDNNARTNKKKKEKRNENAMYSVVVNGFNDRRFTDGEP